jgi:hypothetical protein
MNLVQLGQRFIIDNVVVICKLDNTTFPWTLSLVLGRHMNSGTIRLLGTINNNIIKLSQNNQGEKQDMKQNQHKREQSTVNSHFRCHKQSCLQKIPEVKDN